MTYIGCTLATMLSPTLSDCWLSDQAITVTGSVRGLREKASATVPRSVMLSMLLPVEKTYSYDGSALPSLKSTMASLNWNR